MPCKKIRIPATTESQLLREYASHLEPLQKRWYELQAANLVREKGDHLIEEHDMFVCGTNLNGWEQCRCGTLADLLCDGTKGRGVTCDLPICGSCAVVIGPDLHLCPTCHALAE